MKPITYALVSLSLLWIDIAWRAVTKPEPVKVITLTRMLEVRPANFVVPIQECSRSCRAKWYSAQIGKPVTAGKGTK